MREMKDSGVKWVGEIPSSWKVYKVKQIADSNNDVLPENYEEEQEIDYIEIGSVTYEHGVRTTEKMKFGNAPSRARRIVHNGDTIISTVRTYLKGLIIFHIFFMVAQGPRCLVNVCHKKIKIVCHLANYMVITRNTLTLLKIIINGI